MSSFASNDLFNCLAQLLSVYHSPVSVEDLKSGLPLNPANARVELFTGSNLLDNFSRAAARAGFKTRLQQKQLAKISNLVLPAVLVFRDGDGCVLDSIDAEKKTVKILLPEAGDAIIEKTFAELAEIYSGYVFLVAEAFDYDNRGKDSLELGEGHWLFSAIKISWPIYLDVLIASAIINMFALISPIFTMNVYDRVVPNNAIETLWVLAIGVFIVFAFDATLKLVRTHFIETAAKKTDIIISSRLFMQVMNLRMENAPKNVGAFASNLREFDSVRNFLTSSVVLTLVDLPFTIFLMAAVYYLAGKIVIIPIVITSLIILYGLIIKTPLYKSIADIFEGTARKNSVIIETLSGLEDIKFLNATGSFQYKWEKVVAELAGKGIKTRLISASMSTFTGVMMQLETVLIVIAGVYMIQAQQMTMGALIAVVMISSRILGPVAQFVGLLSGFDQTRVAYQSTNEIMMRPAEIAKKETVKKHEFAGQIEFIDVDFTYPDNENATLKNLSFKINKGEKVAIIGRTGSGKTTIQKLVAGLYKATSGSILIDSLEINQLSLPMLRKNLSYVSQNFTLFSGSLRENILYKAPYADDRMLLQAAVIGGLENMIRSHPRGIDAHVQERGGNLSGGQRQGVAIARAFIAQAPIILLDEPTNSMDGTTEAIVKAHLKRLIENKTTILTTHKNSMLALVNRVIVIDEGKKVFDGSRDDFFKHFSQAGKKGAEA